MINKAGTKYALFAVISILGLILFGQFVAQLYTLRQLNRVNGKILKTSVDVTSYTSGTKWKGGEPIYSFAIALTNGQFFDFDLKDDEWQIENILKKGDDVTIYYPTMAYDLFSMNILEYGTKGSQLEYGGKILYRFTDQKKEHGRLHC